MRVDPLDRSNVAAAQVLAEACAFDRAASVADEKLFGDAPGAAPHAFGVRDGERLVGVAAVAGKWLRVLAVVPEALALAPGRLQRFRRDAFDAATDAARDEIGEGVSFGKPAHRASSIARFERASASVFCSRGM